MERSSYRPKYPVQTLEKSMEVLLYMVNHPDAGGVSITELSEHTGLSKSGVHRILDTWLSYRVVEKAAGAQTYRLGWGLYEMGLAVPAGSSLLSAGCEEAVARLCAQVGETVNLGIRSGGEVVILCKREPDSRLHANISVGEREPLHATSLGKIFLSACTSREVEEYFTSHQAERLTERTIVTAEAMERELEEVRRRGYAIERGEFDRDLLCAAMPVRDYTGDIAAALSVSGYQSRMDGEKLEQVLRGLKETSERISRALGWGAK